jgi:mono/diheme cytochrome c family protein
LRRALTVKLVAPATIAIVLTAAWGRLDNVHARGATREPTRSVWDSVYTPEQATRGDSLYRQGCVKCHGAELAGGADGSPLTGKAFLGNWNGLTVGDLYDRIYESMPPETPKSLERQSITDVMAFVLAKNGFPAGAQPLESGAEKQRDVRIEPSKTGPATESARNDVDRENLP